MKPNVLLRIGSLFFALLLGFKLVLFGISAFSFQHSFLCKIHSCIHHESSEENDEESESKRILTEEKTEAVFFDTDCIDRYTQRVKSGNGNKVSLLPSITLSVPTPPPDRDFI